MVNVEIPGEVFSTNTDASAQSCIATIACGRLDTIPDAVPEISKYGVCCERIERVGFGFQKVGLMYDFLKSAKGLTALRKVVPKEPQETYTTPSFCFLTMSDSFSLQTGSDQGHCGDETEQPVEAHVATMRRNI
ncbi:hypothetical protein V5O48_004938 [Marasmius crinis-equi]|uniref:Uncharacterized protein n=1 Tax=Marasmius crinis-equi TaxID=585013 RepID=A0ABR3FNP6_9AGAR